MSVVINKLPPSLHIFVVFSDNNFLTSTLSSEFLYFPEALGIGNKSPGSVPRSKLHGRICVEKLIKDCMARMLPRLRCVTVSWLVRLGRVALRKWKQKSTPSELQQKYTSQLRSVCLCMCCVLSCVRLFATPWTRARQAPLSMGFPRQEC